MIVKLTVQNNLGQEIVINSDSATGQPLSPNHGVEVTFSLVENAEGIAELHLYVDPA